jgi:ADP-heptose:LPS heptosyltransferase
MATFYIRAPDHLGDGVMALPAIQAILALGPAQIDGPRWAEALYGSRDTSRPSAQTAVLFKPSFSAVWRARSCARRIGVDWDLRGLLLTDRVQQPPGHRIAEYAKIAAVIGARALGLPTYESTAAAPALPEQAVLLLPLSKSPQTVGWAGFRALADALDGRAVFAAGPGEETALAQIAGPHRVLPDLSLPALAEVARQAAAVVGNDSGLTHLAAAGIRGAGQDPNKVHVVYGSTDPEHTGPPGTTPHRLSPLPCWPCYQKSCRIGQPAPCLGLSHERLLGVL